MASLEKARRVKTEDYTKDSLVDFTNAISAAEALYDKMIENGQGNSTEEPVTDEDLRNATQALDTAMSKLVKLDPTDPVDPTDPTDPVDPVDPVEPADPKDPVDSSNNGDETSSPENDLPATGVDSNASLFIISSSLILIGAVFLFFKKKSDNKELN